MFVRLFLVSTYFSPVYRRQRCEKHHTRMNGGPTDNETALRNPTVLHHIASAALRHFVAEQQRAARTEHETTGTDRLSFLLCTRIIPPLPMPYRKPHPSHNVIAKVTRSKIRRDGYRLIAPHRSIACRVQSAHQQYAYKTTTAHCSSPIDSMQSAERLSITRLQDHTGSPPLAD